MPAEDNRADAEDEQGGNIAAEHVSKGEVRFIVERGFWQKLVPAGRA